MKMLYKLYKPIRYALVLATMVILASPQLYAASMGDYCITPPLIGVPTKPNLMIMIDNSASMDDLNYIDKGTLTRPATYCYDNTYRSDNTYAGYFETDIYYDYNFTNSIFSETASFPSSCPNATDTPNTIPNTLFVCYSTSRTVTKFTAAGQYLNWLTMSKFDIEKQILTGGKYDAVSQYLIAESRGCVGHNFIKQPLTADYVEGGTNTPLGITFGITGPVDQYNPSSPSPGGQTYIDVYKGAYNSEVCQTAIDNFADPLIQKQELIDSIAACIGYSSTNQNTCQYLPSFTCTSDAQCGYSSTAGTCGAVVANGTCGLFSGGICSSTPGGICTHNDGTCPATTGNLGSCVKNSNGNVNCTNCCNSNADCGNNVTCTRKCVGGAKAGSVCGTNTTSSSALCASSYCSAGDTSKTSCSIDSDCNLKNCTNAGLKNGQACTTNAGCDTGKCTAGKSNTTDCLLNSDCNSATAYCTAGKPNTTVCTVNSDCDLTIIGNGRCLPPASVQLKSTYSQSMHTCYQLLFKGQSLTTGDLNTISGNNGCNSFYPTYKTCNGGSKDGLVCTGAADCPSGTCINGPNAIRPGSPVLICGSDYAGYCASSTDNWVTTKWNPMEYTSADACVTAAITAYCGATQVPNVTDPTENASVTGQFANLPAVLSDTGLGGQLGDPIAQMPVTILRTDMPTGLIQQFDSSIRMGAMTFNVFGSPSECTPNYPPPANAVGCPQVCSTDPSRLCGSKLDCPFPTVATCKSLSTYTGAKTCYNAGSFQQISPVTSCASDADCGIGQACMPGNSDGAKIVHYIGYGTCYDKTVDPMTQITPIVQCTIDANCGANQTCKSDGAGSHSSGLINTIDSIKGATWTPFAEGFYNAVGYFGKMSDNRSNTNLRINPADFKENYNPSQVVCQKNNVLLVSDGMSTADQNSDVNTFASWYTSGTPVVNGPLTGSLCGAVSVPYKGSINLDNLAWAAKNRKISELVNNTAITTVPSKPNESITTYVVLNGASNGLDPLTECNSETLLTNTALNGGTTLKKAETPEQLKTELNNALWQIAAGAVSGTAASVLASGEGSGANLIQAVFYPSKKFINSATGIYDEITWTGRLTNLWYYVDPYFGSSSIRENGVDLVNGVKVLDLDTDTGQDYVTMMYYDTVTETAMAKRWQDTNGDGTPDGTQLSPDIAIENIKSLWEAGTLLWQRDVTVASEKRKIYTSLTGTSLLAGNFSSNSINPLPATGTPDDNNSTTLAPYLNVTADEAPDLINWVQGIDKKVCSNAASTPCTTDAACTSPGTCGYLYRSRTVKVDLNGDGDTLDAGETTAHVWKLGDILNSTPKILSYRPLNTYHKVNGDKTYGVPYEDSLLGDPVDANRYTTTSAYKSRGMVFVGGNDGMLHAFKLGKLELKWSGQQRTEVARLTGADLGKEMWAFIPKHALPYLKYMADTGYCHLYSVDLTPYMFDASIGAGAGDESTTARSAATWRTILIGGMRYGGACKNKDTPCAGGGTDCVNTPVDGLGYSSYFALDITNQDSPSLLWEFSDENIPVADRGLGFSTAGPVALRMHARDGAGNALPDANGKWFMVFASGPTGPIKTADHQFLGRSDQNLKLFVLDLKSGTLLRTIDTTIPDAFAGNMLGTAFDEDTDGQNDAVYVPYVKKCTSTNAFCTVNTWTDGGVGRLLTRENTDPSQWVFRKVIDGIGPVTATVDKLLNKETKTHWLFFGTGRYFYEESGSADDGAGQRHIFGIKDPCYSLSSSGFDPACTTVRSFNDLINVTDVLNVTSNPDSTSYYGWYIALAPEGAYVHPPEGSRLYNSQRNITDPSASTRGLVYFTTYKPYDDDCALTGRTSIWAVKYDTGGPAVNLLTGTLMIQLSTGQIAQIHIDEAFRNPDDPTGDPKREVMMNDPGTPPLDPVGTFSPRKAVKKIMHIKER